MPRSTPLVVMSAVLLAFTTTIASATTINVTVGEYFFQPANITVRPGDVVHWTNTGSYAHTVTSSKPATPGHLFDAPLNPGQSFDWTVPTPPVSSVTLQYLCSFHPTLGQKGSLKITK